MELVDISPEELQKRLEEGKIYRKEQAGRAAANFFTVENLSALREISAAPDRGPGEPGGGPGAGGGGQGLLHRGARAGLPVSVPHQRQGDPHRRPHGRSVSRRLHGDSGGNLPDQTGERENIQKNGGKYRFGQTVWGQCDHPVRRGHRGADCRVCQRNGISKIVTGARCKSPICSM